MGTLISGMSWASMALLIERVKMASIFLSHSSKDATAVKRMAEWLSAEGFTPLLVDFDPALGIPAGRTWERELYASLRKADAVIFLGSTASASSQWCFAEVSLARSLGKPVFPIALESGVRLNVLDDVQWLDLAADGEAAFASLRTGLERAGLSSGDSSGADLGQTGSEASPTLDPYEVASNLANDVWTTGDQLGYWPYAKAISEFVRHPDTRPPCTIGIKGPWGVGKTSLMRMVQDDLDPPQINLSEDRGPLGRRQRIQLINTSHDQNATTTRRPRWRSSVPRLWQRREQVTNRTVLRKLDDQARAGMPEQDVTIPRPTGSAQADAEQMAAAPISGGDEGDWRPTVWFNPWMYQSGEQIWAGLAFEIISQITGRMETVDRERFWLQLNLRRVDPDAVRRKLHRALLERLLPTVSWIIGAALVASAMLLIRSLIPVAENALTTIARAVLAGGPIVALIQGIWRWRIFLTGAASGVLPDLVKQPDYGGLRGLLGEETKDAYAALVRDPGYEHRLGFLYLVQTDMSRVLNLVATETRPVVIFIDDLDRCAPGAVVQVIEAINLFLAGQFPNCIFIIAMEPEMVAAHIETAYKELGNSLQAADYWGQASMLGWRFLDKIVQLPLTLPVLEVQQIGDFAGIMLTGGGRGVDLPRDVESASGERSTNEPEGSVGNVAPISMREVDASVKRKTLSELLRDDAPMLQEVVSTAASWLDNNPREIKRFVNVFRFYAAIRQEREIAGLATPRSLSEVAKLAVLAVRWPRLRNSFSRRIGQLESETVLAVLERSIREAPGEAEWRIRQEAVVKTLESMAVPERLCDELVREDLFHFLVSEPSIGGCARGFL